MINVVASISLKPGTREQFLQHFNANVPEVRRETGCLEYFPAIDVDADIAIQLQNADEVTVIEKWESVAALHAHLAAPHMKAYQEQVKDLVVGVSLKVLTDAFGDQQGQ